MKIAILTSGILPVPAVKGGAVETHIDFYLKYNNEHKLHDMTVYSIADKDIIGRPELQSTTNHYIYINTNSWGVKIQKKIFHLLNKDTYYHYSIDFFFHKVWKMLNKECFDIILFDNRPGYAVNITPTNNTKFVYYLHNDLLNKESFHAEEIYKKATRIITVSNFITNCVKTINPNDTKCITVYNGININAFSPTLKSNISRSQLAFSRNDFIIAFWGRVIPEKGILELIRALKQIKNNNIKLLVIGSPFYGNTDNEDSFVQSLKQEALSIKERIRFTGFIPYIKLPNFLRIADIAIVPSKWEEPFGNTIVEAMAAGLPLITTHSGGIPEICEGVATIVGKDNLVNNLTNAILDLYEHPEKRKRLSIAALERSKYFDEETYAKNFFAALEGLKE